MPRSVAGRLHPEQGARVQVRIDHPEWARDRLLEGQEPLTGLGAPRAVTGWAIIDTGAATSCIDRHVADRLQLLASGSLRVTGVTAFEPGKGIQDPWAYATRRVVHVEIVGLDHPFELVIPEVEPLGEPIMLLGRDVLGELVLTWDGPRDAFLLDEPDDDELTDPGTVP